MISSLSLSDQKPAGASGLGICAIALRKMIQFPTWSWISRHVIPFHEIASNRPRFWVLHLGFGHFLLPFISCTHILMRIREITIFLAHIIVMVISRCLLHCLQGEISLHSLVQKNPPLWAASSTRETVQEAGSVDRSAWESPSTTEAFPRFAGQISRFGWPSNPCNVDEIFADIPRDSQFPFVLQVVCTVYSAVCLAMIYSRNSAGLAVQFRCQSF